MPGLQTTTIASPPSLSPHEKNVWEYSVPLEHDQYQQGSAPSSFKSRGPNYPITSESSSTHSRVNGHSSRHNEHNSSRVASSSYDSSAFLDPSKQDNSLRRKHSNISSTLDGDSALDLHGGRTSAMGTRSLANGENDDLTDEESKWIDSEKLARIEGKQLDSSKWIDKDKLERIEGKQLEESKWIDKEKLEKIEGKQLEDSKWIDKDKLEQIEGKQLENSRWIDKEKLEQIEIQELEQAGIRVPLKARGSYNMLQENHQSESQTMERSRTSSGSSGTEGDERLYDPSEPDNDLRHPSERLYEQRHPMRMGQRNGSFSRIPLFTSSPLPVKQQHIERTTPLVRNGPSPEQGSDDDSISYPRSRKRSHSASSGHLLNENYTTTTKVPSTPRNVRSQSHTPTASTVNRSPSKSAARASSNAKNKGRSSAPLTPTHHRPGTAHQAPEGPPPWSLSTYSPDPKLPPEQQLIPTVAKRLQQEQWEKEGVFATVYDGKLRPLKVEDIDSLRPKKREGPEKMEVDNTKGVPVQDEWPLRSPPLKPAASPSPPSPEPAVEEKKETPPITKNEDLAPRTITKINDRTVGHTSSRHSHLSKPNPGSQQEKKKEKKKFLCCIIM